MFLSPPFNPELLARIIGRTLECTGNDIRYAATWLLRHSDLAGLTANVGAHWKKCLLPLALWADRIDEVKVSTSEDCVGLEVHVLLRGGRSVCQQAPLSPDQLRACKASLPSLPGVLTELALSAPGLQLDAESSVGNPEFFLQPLARVERWSAMADPDMVVAHGYANPDCAIHMTEIAAVGVESYYVLGHDGSLYYYDGDVPGLVPCTVSLNDWMMRYFRDPSQIAGPYARGLAHEPSAVSAVTGTTGPPVLHLMRLIRELTQLGCLALAVRACQRSLPEAYGLPTPVAWSEPIKALAEMIQQCQEVCVIGAGIDGEKATLMANRAQEVAHELFRLQQEACATDGSDALAVYSGAALGMAVADLARGATLVNDSARKAASGCAGMSVVPLTRILQAQEAAIVDSEALVLLDGGGPRTRGRTVPDAFFRRPLWPISRDL